MEDQQQKTPFKLKFKIKRSIDGVFRIEKSHPQENSEKKTMGFLTKLKNQLPSSSMAEKSRTETYSNSNSANSSCDIRQLQWSVRAKRGRKSLESSSSSTSSFSSLSSDEKQKEPSLCEMEVAESLLMLADGFSLNFSEQNPKNEDRIITEFPDIKKKRKLEDTTNMVVDYAEHHSKKGRIEKEITRVYRDGFMLDTVKIPKLSSGNFSCAFCGKSFSCYQALGGHTSKCKINSSKGEELAQFAAQGSMRIKISNQIDGSSKRLHECKLCTMKFPTGQALGGHQRTHRIVKVEPRISSSSSVSPPTEISKEESMYPIDTVAVVAVHEAKDDLSKTKITLFDLNEHPLEEEDELLELRLS